MGGKTIMDFLIVLLSVSYILTPASAAMSKEMMESSKKLLKSMCTSRSGVNPALITKLKNGEFVDDPKLKCYANCCLQRMKIMNKDKITYESAQKQISQLPEGAKEVMMASLEACRKVEGSDGCDIGYKFVECAYKLNDGKAVVIPA